MEQTFRFSAIPENTAQLRTIPEAALTSPFQTAALTALVLCRYIIWKSSSVFGVRSSFVLHFFCFTQLRAFRLSE